MEYDDPTCSATGTEMMRIFKAERARAVVEAAEHDEEPEVYLRFRSEEFYRVYSIPGKPPVAPPPEPTSDRPAGTVDLSVFGNARPAEHHNSKFKCDRGHEILTPRTHPREGRTAPAAVVSMACNADFGATVSVVDCRALLPEAPAAGTTADAGAPASGTPAGAGAPATVTAADAGAPATGTPAGAGAPATVTAADAAPATGTPAAAQESTVAAAFCDVGADPKAGPGAPPALPAPSLDALCAAPGRAPGMVRTRSLCAA